MMKLKTTTMEGLVVVEGVDEVDEDKFFLFKHKHHVI